MGKENMVYKHNGMPFIYKKEWDHVICRKMDKTGGYHVELNNPGPERQTLNVLPYM